MVWTARDRTVAGDDEGERCVSYDRMDTSPRTSVNGVRGTSDQAALFCGKSASAVSSSNSSLNV